MEGDGDKLCTMAQRSIGGDDFAFVELCNMLKRKLYKIAMGMLGSESLALEAIDESVYKAFIGIRKLKQPQYVTTWFVRILLNVCHDMLRKRKREVFVAELQEEYMQKEYGSSDYDGIIIRDLMNALPEDLKQIVSMKYFSDFTLSEISKILHIPVGTVKSKLNRALKLLRMEVEK